MEGSSLKIEPCMETFLFDSIIIGPIHSRRLGTSLGVNLLAPDAKLCNFNCIYCECGWNGAAKKRGAFNPTQEVIGALEAKLKEMAAEGKAPDVVTFAGNGEPTMHPDFPYIIDQTIRLRDAYVPQAKIAVLSNATMIDREPVRSALHRVDRNILKLDSAIDSTVELINQPQKKRTVRETIDLLKLFNGDLVIQTMFLRGEYNGQVVDNTTPPEVDAWLAALREIKPREVMIYTIDRNTPADHLQKVPYAEMQAIADRINGQPGLEKTIVSVAK